MACMFWILPSVRSRTHQCSFCPFYQVDPTKAAHKFPVNPRLRGSGLVMKTHKEPFNAIFFRNNRPLLLPASNTKPTDLTVTVKNLYYTSLIYKIAWQSPLLRKIDSKRILIEQEGKWKNLKPVISLQPHSAFSPSWVLLWVMIMMFCMLKAKCIVTLVTSDL